MAKIEYATKVSNNGQTVNGIFFSADANEIKEAVNALYDMLLQDRTVIPVTSDGNLTIANWQTNLVPNDPLTRTYAARFGNIIRDVKGMQLMPNGSFELYSPSTVSVTYSGDLITTATFYTVFIGKLSIL